MSEDEYVGIDTEGSAVGLDRNARGIHSVQTCSSRGEASGKVFYSPDDFKEWYRHCKPRPKLFYAFTLPFEYGSLAAWQLLRSQTGKSKSKSKFNWQTWTDEPINLFYIQIDKTKIPIFDVRIFFHQLSHNKEALTNLKKLGDYLSDYYGVDAHKLPPPLGADFGKRAPTEAERPYFEKYGIRDAYICALAAKWIHDNVVGGWLAAVPLRITDLFSWGTVAKYYFDFPALNTVHHYGKKVVVDFPNLWHERIFNACFAGRSEAFMTGNVGHVYYCDVSSLYPVSLIQTQAFLIRDVAETSFACRDKLLGKASWQQFYEATGVPYGWILGDFRTDSDLWGLPIEQGENNWFVTGTLRNQLYHTLDLEASDAEILRVDRVLIPEFGTRQASIDRMGKFETLTDKKLSHKCESELEEKCIKMTTNSAHGTLGQSDPHFAAHTNLPAYNTVLAQSHLYMSQLFHKFAPIIYTDTDSFFIDKPVNGTIRNCVPYPTLPFQRLATVPLIVDVKAQSKPTGAIVFRGKMYGDLTFEGANINAFSAWHPKADNFVEILAAKPTQTFTVEQQTSRKWLTKNKAARLLRVGGFYVQTVEWDLAQLKRIFRADSKRKRPTYDSYQLFLDSQSATSRSWTVDEALSLLADTPWHTDLETGRMTETALLANINADFERVFADK